MLALFENPYVLAILGYLLALVGVGYYKSRVVKTGEDFMVAGRTLPWWVLVGTLLATWMGSGSLFGSAGLGYRNGMAGLWSSAGAWAGIALIYFIAQRIRHFGKVTVPDIFEARYGRISSVLATIATIIAYLTIVSYQFRGGGNVLHFITQGTEAEISVQAGIVITAVFAIAYTALAGMLSVVYTDVVNGALMVLGVFATVFFMAYAVGGMDEIVLYAEAAGKWELFGNWANERSGATSGPIVAISFLIPTMLLLMGDANMYQRIFSAKDGAAAQKAVFFWVIGVVVLESAVYFVGLTGAAAADQGLIPELFAGGAADVAANQSEYIIPTLAVSSSMPLALGMMLVATMMAIIVSTADSFLLVPATNLTRDVVQRFIAPNMGSRAIVLMSRGWVLLLGIVAWMLVDQFPTILTAAYTAYLVYGTSITPALLAAFLWKRATAAGAVASILTGTSVTLAWTFWMSEQAWFGDLHPFLQEVTYPAVILSVLALVGASLATTPPDRARWEPFFGG